MLQSAENVSELKRITEAAALEMNSFHEGSRTFCKLKKIKCQLALKISEVRMLT